MTMDSRQIRQLEHRIEEALAPGMFIRYDDGSSYVLGLGAVEDELAKLATTDSSEAVLLYETFLAGCYEKAEEVDDSGGDFGLFVVELYCGWIRARQQAGADPAETAERILRWMEDDRYGFSYQLEKEASKAFDSAGLAAFVSAIRQRFDACSGSGEAAHEEHDRARWRSGAGRRAGVSRAGRGHGSDRGGLSRARDDDGRERENRGRTVVGGTGIGPREEGQAERDGGARPPPPPTRPAHEAWS